MSTNTEYEARIETSDAKQLAKIRTMFLNAKGVKDAKDAFEWIKSDPKALKQALSKEGLACRVADTNEVWRVFFRADYKWTGVIKDTDAQESED